MDYLGVPDDRVGKHWLREHNLVQVMYPVLIRLRKTSDGIFKLLSFSVSHRLNVDPWPERCRIHVAVTPSEEDSSCHIV